MISDVIAHMRSRIERIQKVIDLAHDPQMIAMLQDMIDEAREDIRRLEAEESNNG